MYRLRSSRKTVAVRLASQQMRDDIYERLEYRRGINPDVYMTLQKKKVDIKVS